MLVVGVVSVLVFKTRGLIFMYPAEIREIAEFKIDNEAYRINRCFIDKDAEPSSFLSECLEYENKKEHSVFLWGDSHAAALYPGLKKLKAENNAFSLSQFTSSGCPPPCWVGY
ncbi:MAG: hypothetical protein IT362_08770 [Deltaproteobacteria bacterium]|nr:hypothetical protein [Deltaproteobacteria bacterium]